MYQILVVEDVPDIYEQLAEILRNEGFGVIVADSQRSAINILELPENAFDLALVDLTLPDGGSGFVVYRAAEERNIPVIFLTASDDEYTHAHGLDMGAVDYITKPYKPKVLMAHIRSALRKSGKMSHELSYRDLLVDANKGTVYKNGEELFLSRLEYRLLLLFMNSPGRLFSRDSLLEEIWSITGVDVSENTLSKHIERLRDKLGDDPQNQKYIQTVRGMGYKLGE